MSNLSEIYIVPDLVPLFGGIADVRCAWGGRGSGKTRSFALMCAANGYRFWRGGESGIILCARQFQNSLADSSLIEIKRAIESYPFLRDCYDIGERYIKTRDGRIEFQFVGLDRNISSVKSMGRILLCWVDEAEPVTQSAWDILIPTLREEGVGFNTELWVTWNPLRREAPVERNFRHGMVPKVGYDRLMIHKDSDRILGVEINYDRNPLFPAVLERARLLHLKTKPETYAHVWEGAYYESVEGAYYQRQMLECESEGRICSLRPHKEMMLRAFWDIGGTGHKSDATAIWIAQFIQRKEIWVLDYYEAQGQPLSEHIAWLHSRGYSNALMVLPHDGSTRDRVYSVSYESALSEAGFNVQVIRNRRGAVMERIDCVRRMFPFIYFNESTTRAGRQALSWYHQKWDSDRGIGLGAEHDWSSHGADAFGLMCISYEEPPIKVKGERYGSRRQQLSNSWMCE